MDFEKYMNNEKSPSKSDFQKIQFGRVGSIVREFPLNTFVADFSALEEFKGHEVIPALQKATGIKSMHSALIEHGFAASINDGEAEYRLAARQHCERRNDRENAFKRDLAVELRIHDLPGNVGKNIVDKAWEDSHSNGFESVYEDAYELVDMIQPLIEDFRNLTSQIG
ncbi:hypothetical protein [Aeromonas media]|uniref:hypothetical protein n=1 Tax=Aeromonas media TaxID=651 RepID=UPI003D218D1B